MEGYDLEVGVPVPFLPEFCNLWLFGGLYDFNNPFGGDLDGFQGRLEWRLNPSLCLETAYFTQDRFITGDNWYFGIRGSLPLEGSGNFLANLFRPKSNAGSDRPWLRRVRRDGRHRMTETGWGCDAMRTFTKTSSGRFSQRTSTTKVTVTEIEREGERVP
jgi:hypothetical protein